jgi:hypothetical protein
MVSALAILRRRSGSSPERFPHVLISLRSHLIAGTAAVIGAGSVAVAGVHQPLPALPASATVALAAFNNPIEQLLGTLEVGQNYLLGTYYEGSDSPLTPGAGEFNWPFAGMDQVGGDVLNYALYNEIALGNYYSVGLLPQLTNQANPIIRQLTTNLFTYLNAGLSGVIDSVAAASAGVWDFPAAAVDAFELALNGQINEAITVLTDAVVTPIVEAGGALFDTAAFVVTDFLAKTVAVLEVIPVNLALFAGAAFGGAAVLAERSVQIATAWVDSLAAGEWEGAWNVAVDGLLGPSGLPGTALNLTIGAGVQTGAIVDPQTDIAENFVPSFRTATQATIWNTQNALTATVPPLTAVIADFEVSEPPAAAVVSVAPGAEAPAAVETGEPPAEAVVSVARGAEVPAAVEAAATVRGETESAPKRVKSNRAGKRAARG